MSRMAIAFARARYISRASGGSAVRSAAYNGRDKIEAQRTGEVFYFAHRDPPDHHEVLLPEGAPKAFLESAALWNAAEAAEKRRDAQVAREIVLALPANSELGHEDRVELTRSFALEHFVSKGLAVQFDVHAPHGAESESERANHHAHLLITTRRLDGNGFAAKKARDLDPVLRQGKGRAVVTEAEAWGATWRDHQNRYFVEHGLDIRVDATSAVPQEHIGPVRMRAPDAEANARADEIARANAAAARDPDQVLAVMTRNSATFTERDLDRHLARHIGEDAELREVRAKVLQHKDLLSLHDRETGEIAGRFTTRAVRAQEKEALADSARVAAGAHRDIGHAARQAAPSSAALRPDQRAAFEHATGGGGLKIIEGRAGTGKSFALGAIRDAHEAAGYKVVGLAPTNAVAQDLKHDGFARSSTVHAELFRLKNGHVIWDRRTLVVLDEAAMLDAKVTGELLREAKLAGAKVVAAGDDRQLASIERGGLFTELKKGHGSVEIKQVRRQRVDWQRDAARDLSEGRFEEALRAFARNKAIIWTNRQDETHLKLVEQWTKDTAADPAASRFVFAYTNKDVDVLNRSLRQVRRERGELGADHIFTTKHGQAAFAVGDRVQFTDTLKGAGIYNGNAGVITGIERETGRISARLDAPAGREGRRVDWSASEFTGFRHGYAGTIYKGQGKTLDHTYLLHTRHWRAASSYVALTRQRESVKVFVAVETARDIRQLARQIGRSEIKSASIAYATRDELTREQITKLREKETVAMARGSVERQGERFAGVRAEPGAAREDGTSVRPPAQEATSSSLVSPLSVGTPLAKSSGEAQEPVSRRRAHEPPSVEAPRVAPAPAQAAMAPPETAASLARTAGPGVLIPAFETQGRDSQVRDSLGRGVDAKSLASVVSADVRVRREQEARAVYLETAYRDPKAATARLSDLVSRDGATSAARRLSTDLSLLGELRGREGLFAGGTARAERQAATRAAAAIGPSLTRTSEAEAQAAQGYRASVEAQLKADRTAIPNLSEQAVAALGIVAAAKTDQARADAFKALSAEPETKREIDTFRKTIEARFGEDGARALVRVAAAGKSFEHASVPKAQQAALDAATRLYAAARSAERQILRAVESQRLSARQSHGSRLKPL
ncbi:Ti-type conjugative transfer relaxase TraA [Rhizobiales bacterium GAS191]|nr:Ti-type conjugative transfer relaxase TraA [Rhizobiales bacterium GAS191]